MSPAVEAFRELARRYSIAVRIKERVAAQGKREELDEAISLCQDIENEFSDCFVLVRTPPCMGLIR